MSMDGPDLASGDPRQILSGTPHLHQHSDPGKKRSKSARPDESPSSGAGGSRKPKYSRKAEEGAPKITRPCSECGKTFWSWKALFGHMRCHPERQWRGINPPPNHPRDQFPDHFDFAMTVEDHQVAESLLLLANGGGAEEERNVNVGDGGGRFECSSCKKVFGSHQALGGHRASHKNVKGCFAITRSTESEIDDHQGLATVRSSSISHDSHMCSICLRVFSSGQALGGHKRCHWEEPSVNHGANSRGAFDLNLPPQPEDNDHTTVTSSGSYSSGLTLDLRLRL